MSEFFAMDGYALFVWPAYAVTVLLMAWAAIAPWLQHRRLRRAIRRGNR
ncbi:MAG: heme exporter protein CcmD [Xanthomonadaceae bacterium]|nr:heme exporter protein CcmD [Xanthomonadaceae bacterium]